MGCFMNFYESRISPLKAVFQGKGGVEIDLDCGGE